MSTHSMFVIMILSSCHSAVGSAAEAASASMKAESCLNDDLWKVLTRQTGPVRLVHDGGQTSSKLRRETDPKEIAGWKEAVKNSKTVVLGNTGKEPWGPTDFTKDQLISVLSDSKEWKLELLTFAEDERSFVMFRKEGKKGMDEILWFVVNSNKDTFWHWPLNDMNAPLNLVFQCGTKPLLKLLATYQSRIHELESKSSSQIGDLQSDLADAQKQIGVLGAEMEQMQSQIQLEASEKNKLIKERDDLQNGIVVLQGDLDGVKEQLRLRTLENIEANRQIADEQAPVEQELTQQRLERQSAEIELDEGQ